MSTARAHIAILLGLVLLVALPRTTSAEAPTTIAGKKIAVLPFDALGLEGERVRRLESLFRQELGRLSGQSMPTAAAIHKHMRRNRRCVGGAKCLAKIGRALGVDYVLVGNVASLGDSYVVNIKAIDTRTKKEVRRIASEPLRGDPDELIETVRVAAYNLLAPSKLIGSIRILADLPGAEIIVDGRRMGTTPLSKPISGLSLGDHTIEVKAKGFSKFKKTVRVRFQKETRAIVRLAETPTEDAIIKRSNGPTRSAPKAWYKSKWVVIGVGAAAIIIGSAVGYGVANDDITDCTGPQTCL